MELTSLVISMILGTACGVISGFGIGGGSILMVWMTAVVMIDQRIAQGINLLYFIPTSVAALYSHIKSRMIEWSVVIPTATSGCVTAILGALGANMLPIRFLNKLFGIFLCIVGVNELLYKPNRKRIS